MTLPQQPRDNPARPLLSIFLSYSVDDRYEVIPLVDGLRAAGIEVIDFQDDEPIGADIAGWIETRIAEADAILVVVSAHSLGRPEWVEREVGLAIGLLAGHGSFHPEVIPVRLDCRDLDRTVRFQPRNFHTRQPVGPPIVWRDVNCLRIDRDGVGLTVEQFVRRFAPRTTLLTDPESAAQIQLFEGAMRLYGQLLPDARERDREVDIAHWLTESWDADGRPEPAAAFVHVLAVQHTGDKVIGMFWGTVHRPSGLGFVAFWGLVASHRARARGVTFALDVIARARAFCPGLRALLFAAERVDWGVLDRFLRGALARWRAATGRHPPTVDWHRVLDQPLADGPSALASEIAQAPPRTRHVVVEHLRRFRRFALFANGANFNAAVERQGVALLAFTHRDAASDDRPAPDSLARSPVMAEFVQPPIRPPVAPAGDCHLWLFALMVVGQTLTPAEAVDWIYDTYLKGSLGAGRTQLPGWNQYMVDFKARWRDAFVDRAELRHLRLRDRFAPYNLLLTAVKRHWVRQKAIDGSADDRWNIQL